MNEVKAIRYAGWAGVIGVLLLAASFSVASWTDPTASDAALRADIADADGQAYTAYTMLTPAVALLLWFATGLRRFLLVRCRADRLAAAVLPGMVFFTGLFSAGATLITASTFTDAWVDEFRIDVNLFRALSTGGYFLIFIALVGGAAVVAATSRAAHVAGAIPPWMAWVGYVVAFAAVFGIWTFGYHLLAFALWLLGAAIGLIRGAGALAAAGPPPAPAEAEAAPGAAAGVPGQAAAPAEEPHRAEPAP